MSSSTLEISWWFLFDNAFSLDFPSCVSKTQIIFFLCCSSWIHPKVLLSALIYFEAFFSLSSAVVWRLYAISSWSSLILRLNNSPQLLLLCCWGLPESFSSPIKFFNSVISVCIFLISFFFFPFHPLILFWGVQQWCPELTSRSLFKDHPWHMGCQELNLGWPCARQVLYPLYSCSAPCFCSHILLCFICRLLHFFFELLKHPQCYQRCYSWSLLAGFLWLLGIFTH